MSWTKVWVHRIWETKAQNHTLPDSLPVLTCSWGACSLLATRRGCCCFCISHSCPSLSINIALSSLKQALSRLWIIQLHTIYTADITPNKKGPGINTIHNSNTWQFVTMRKTSHKVIPLQDLPLVQSLTPHTSAVFSSDSETPCLINKEINNFKIPCL